MQQSATNRIEKTFAPQILIRDITVASYTLRCITSQPVQLHSIRLMTPCIKSFTVISPSVLCPDRVGGVCGILGVNWDGTRGALNRMEPVILFLAPDVITCS